MSKAKKEKDFTKPVEPDTRSNEDLATDAENVTFDNEDDAKTVAELLRRFENACRQLGKPQLTNEKKLVKVWLKGKPYRVTPEKFALICPGGEGGPSEDEAIKIATS